MSLLLEKQEKREYCPYLHHYYRQLLPIYCKNDFILWTSLWEGSKKTDAELKAEMGRVIVSRLPIEFLETNQGRFIAVTFRGKILAVCDTLEALNEELAKKNIKENYYIERIGHSAIAQI